ncbi:DUF3732 domain-containing protein [Deinococcus sp. 6GRE01]|uniref:DUF3732 domain-containing protein n=1 Tax=Deinococcus sp. 6GRE01 TaxID=2745873 RepID=UPI001E5D2159|nr:DUF3732 domain-containing protein [Deinococcus sp. 6GRE01]
MNIITGKSATGKSALISIVDYCLAGKCEIAGQVIRDHVAWYGLHLQYDTSQVFLARRDPGEGGKESSDYFYIEGEVVEIPETIEAATTNTSSVEELLSAKLGIVPNRHTPPEGQTRHAVSATVRHALLLCFQEQDEIATRKKLFHDQQDFFKMQHFKDTLPLFLGVVDDAAVVLEQQLREERRALRAKRQELKTETDLRGEGISKAVSLIAEARDAGLLPQDFSESLDNLDGAVLALRRALDWRQNQAETSESVAESSLALRFRRDQLNDELQLLRDEIKAVESHIAAESEHTQVIADHTIRLQSIGFYPSDFNHAQCPVCRSALATPLPTIKELHDSLTEMQGNLAHLQSDRPQLLGYLEQLRGQQRSHRQEVRQIEGRLDGEAKVQQTLARVRDQNLVKSHVAGRVSMWLDSVDFTNDLDGLDRDIKLREGRIEGLLDRLDPEARDQRLGALMARIGTQMTSWARTLQLEHAAEGEIRLDLSKLTIVADKGARSMELAGIGSGQNWLGYHLVVHLAIHKFLVEANRPTPRFLFLDQPTQVYFPAEKEQSLKETGSIDPLKDDDQLAVQRVFTFLFDAVEQLEGKFQIIVSDHADLKDDPRYQAAITEEWRGDRALIPTDWVASSAEDSAPLSSDL